MSFLHPRFGLAILIVLLAGCAAAPTTAPRDPGAGASPAFQPPAPAPDATEGAYPLSPAAAALVARADQLIQSGDPAAAGSELERALRIEPRNPRIWQRMAVAKLELNDPVQAETLARKSSALAQDNDAIRAMNWRIIAEARRLAGDQAGYEEAMYRASELSGR